MRTGRPKKLLILNAEERKQLESILRSRSLPATIVRRARIILCSADHMPNDKIAEKLGVTPYTVGYWRKRFLKDRCAGMHDELRSGRPRTMSDEEVAVLINKALRSKPANGTHWSVRSFAEESAVSSSMANRLFRLFGLQPHRSESFKLSNDPFFVEKVRESAGLCLGSVC